MSEYTANRLLGEVVRFAVIDGPGEIIRPPVNSDHLIVVAYLVNIDQLDAVQFCHTREDEVDAPLPGFALSGTVSYAGGVSAPAFIVPPRAGLVITCRKKGWVRGHLSYLQVPAQ